MLYLDLILLASPVIDDSKTSRTSSRCGPLLSRNSFGANNLDAYNTQALVKVRYTPTGRKDPAGVTIEYLSLLQRKETQDVFAGQPASPVQWSGSYSRMLEARSAAQLMDTDPSSLLQKGIPTNEKIL